VPGRDGRYEFEYLRHGTRALIAAFDVHTGQVFGQCRKRRTAKDLAAFMEEVARRYPTGEVYVIWDNLNIHIGEAWARLSERHGDRFHFVHTPKHASWMNQVEIWFSILQRRVLKYADFVSCEQMVRAIIGFIGPWNRREAHPFRWTSAAALHKIASPAERRSAVPHKATQKDADGVAFMLTALGFPHIRARAVADQVLLETGSFDEPIVRIRLRKISREDWRVEMKFDSRWEKTPNVCPRDNMVAVLCKVLRQRQRTGS
jgi:transposase